MACTVNTQVSGLLQNKRMEMYSGTTNGSGIYTITYSTPFVNPMIIPVLIGQDSQTSSRVTSNSTGGFSIIVEQRALLTVLGINLLSFGVTAMAGIQCNVYVIEA